MRGILKQIRPRHLVIIVLLIPTALMLGSLLSETPNPAVYAEHTGFDDQWCGPGWTHKDTSFPYSITDTSGIFTRVGIKSASGCAVFTTNGVTTYGCYLISGIGTSTVTVTDTGAGCDPINYIVAELQYATYTPTPVVGDDTPTPTNTSTPTSTSTSTPTRTPTPTPTIPGPPTRTPTQAPFSTDTPTPTPTEENGEPSPTPTAETATPTPDEYPPTETPTAPPTELPTATPTEIPMIPVTAVDPCCQLWVWLMVVILILQILTIAGVLILAAYVRRREKPQA